MGSCASPRRGLHFCASGPAKLSRSSSTFVVAISSLLLTPSPRLRYNPSGQSDGILLSPLRLRQVRVTLNLRRSRPCSRRRRWETTGGSKDADRLPNLTMREVVEPQRTPVRNGTSEGRRDEREQCRSWRRPIGTKNVHVERTVRGHGSGGRNADAMHHDSLERIVPFRHPSPRPRIGEGLPLTRRRDGTRSLNGRLVARGVERGIGHEKTE